VRSRSPMTVLFPEASRLRASRARPRTSIWGRRQ
jgi:hypothetical protein